MDSAVIVAVISFFATVLGTAGGIVVSAKLTDYRLTQVEKKLDNLSTAVAKIPVMEEKQKTANRRILRLEGDHNHSHFANMN